MMTRSGIPLCVCMCTPNKFGCMCTACSLARASAPTSLSLSPSLSRARRLCPSLHALPRLHYRLLTLCPAPTDPVGQSWPRSQLTLFLAHTFAGHLRKWRIYFPRSLPQWRSLTHEFLSHRRGHADPSGVPVRVPVLLACTQQHTRINHRLHHCVHSIYIYLPFPSLAAFS